jgi:hypothetical protein
LSVEGITDELFGKIESEEEVQENSDLRIITIVLIRMLNFSV